MNRIVSVLFLSTFLALASVPATSHGQDKPRKGFLSVLKEGQSVSVKEVAGRYEITVMKGRDRLDRGRRHRRCDETRIPVYSIKSIVKLKVPKD